MIRGSSLAVAAVSAALSFPSMSHAWDCIPEEASQPPVSAGPGLLVAGRVLSQVVQDDAWGVAGRAQVAPHEIPPGPSLDALRRAMGSVGLPVTLALDPWEGGPAPVLRSKVRVGGSAEDTARRISEASDRRFSVSWEDAGGERGRVVVGKPPLFEMGVADSDSAALAASVLRSAGAGGVSLVLGEGGRSAWRFSASGPVRERIALALDALDTIGSAAVLDGAFVLRGGAFASSSPPDAWSAGPGGLEASAWDDPVKAPAIPVGVPRRIVVPQGVPALAGPGGCLAGGSLEPGGRMSVSFLGWDPDDPSRLRLALSREGREGAPGSAEIPVSPGGIVVLRSGEGSVLAARVRWRAASSSSHVNSSQEQAR